MLFHNCNPFPCVVTVGRRWWKSCCYNDMHCVGVAWAYTVLKEPPPSCLRRGPSSRNHHDCLSVIQLRHIDILIIRFTLEVVVEGDICSESVRHHEQPTLSRHTCSTYSLRRPCIKVPQNLPSSKHSMISFSNFFLSLPPLLTSREYSFGDRLRQPALSRS